MPAQNTLFGVDVFLKHAVEYKNHRIGLVTNNASLTSDAEYSRTALVKAGFNIVKLFSPEHGISTQGIDGSFQQNITDTTTGLPVISLYGDNLIPSSEDIEGVDLFVFDIPDAGTRFYTYLWTLTCIMEACAAHNKPLTILDRPNPLGGNFDLAEGPMLDEENCYSFIGRWSIPIRHCCTYAELAKYFSSIKKINTDISVIEIEGWNRNHLMPEPGWKFISPSPAIRDTETAFLYPGMGLMEGINVNEGRGMDTPFKILGAPWIDSGKLVTELYKLLLPGVKAEPISYTPEDSIYKKEKCNGIKLTVTDTGNFKPVLTGLEIIRLIQNLFPDTCEERLYKTIANPTGKKHLDKLTGVFNSFEKIKTGELAERFYTTGDWAKNIKSFLLY